MIVLVCLLCMLGIGNLGLLAIAWNAHQRCDDIEEELAALRDAHSRRWEP